VASAYFPGSRKREVAIDAQHLQNLLETLQYIPQARKIASSRFRKSHPPGMTAGTRSDSGTLEQGHAFIGR
jgi:hypothetical protein